MTIVLTTERLTLRRLHLSDAQFALEQLNEPAFLRNIGDKGVRTLEDAHKYLLEGPIASYARFGFGLYAVELTGAGTVIGMCGLLQRDYLPQPDIGFSFLERYWGRGYAFEAASAVMEHGRRALGLARIFAVTALDNAGSINVLSKCSFTFERLDRFGGDTSYVRVFVSDP